MNEDEKFKKLTIDTYNTLLFFSQKIKSNSFKVKSLQRDIKNIENKNLNFDDQMKKLNEIFKENVSVNIERYMRIYSTNWEVIKSEYGNISPNLLENECLEIIKDIIDRKVSSEYRMGEDEIKSTIGSGGDCPWKYYLCAAAATAGAILCHGGCDTTALAVTAGLGIPACVALCVTLQAAALVQCQDNYCP